MYFGDWEGMTLEEIRKRFPEELNSRNSDLVHYRPPGQGESIGELSARIIDCLQGILEKHPNQDILLVAHGGVNRVILCHALGLDLARIFALQQDYGCLNIIDYLTDAVLLRLMNG